MEQWTKSGLVSKSRYSAPAMTCIAGFKTVDPEKLDAVPDDVFLDWRRRHWLPPLFAHLFSAAYSLPFTELAIHALSTRQ